MRGPSPGNRISLESFDDWHQAICRDFSLAQFKGAVPKRLAVHLSVNQFGGVSHGDSSLSTDLDLQAARAAADIRRDPRDPFTVMLVRSGEVTVQQDDRVVRGRPGDLFMYDHGRPFSVTLHGSHQVATLGIPRPLLDQRLSNPSRRTARAAFGPVPARALAASLVDQMGHLGGLMDGRASERLSETMLDILALSFDADAFDPTQNCSPARRLLAEAQRYMRAHLHDPELDIDAITKGLGVPPRTLNRLFVGEGTTPMRWLWRQRLAASRRALVDGRAASVTDAAMACGFNDLSHFSRAFKAAFGRLPSSLKDSR